MAHRNQVLRLHLRLVCSQKKPENSPQMRDAGRVNKRHSPVCHRYADLGLDLQVLPTILDSEDLDQNIQ
jgi:hypothetical protein